jgi:hypothetical protein
LLYSCSIEWRRTFFTVSRALDPAEEERCQADHAIRPAPNPTKPCRDLQIASIYGRFADLDLAIPHPNLKTRLRMYCRSVKDTAILQSKSRRMIGADDTVAIQLAF